MEGELTVIPLLTNELNRFLGSLIDQANIISAKLWNMPPNL